MEETNIKIEEVIKTLKELKEENHRLEVENEELKDVFSKVLQLFNNDKEKFFNAIKGELINEISNNKTYKVANKEYNLIDLGLPSGTLWMDRNVGAEKPEDAGLYFAWGETQGYTADEVGKAKKFSWDDYKFGKEDSFIKYNSNDGLIKLDTKDDAVLQNTHKFKMPLYKQIRELIDNTTSVWITQNGVNGRLFTSKTNGNSIFVPATGFAGNGSLGSIGAFCGLWGSSLCEGDTNKAWYFSYSSVFTNISDYGRCGGLPVRGISTI